MRAEPGKTVRRTDPDRAGIPAGGLFNHIIAKSANGWRCAELYLHCSRRGFGAAVVTRRRVLKAAVNWSD